MNDFSNDSNSENNNKTVEYSESGKISLISDEELDEFISGANPESEKIFNQDDNQKKYSSEVILDNEKLTEEIVFDPVNKEEDDTEILEDKEEYQEFIKEFSDDKIDIVKPDDVLEGEPEWVIEDKNIQSARHKVGLIEASEPAALDEVLETKSEHVKKLEVKASTALSSVPKEKVFNSKTYNDEEFEAECEEIVISNSSIGNQNISTASIENNFSVEVFCEWSPLKKYEGDAIMSSSEAEEILKKCKEGDKVSMVGASTKKSYWVSYINLLDDEYFLSNDKGNTVQELTYGQLLGLIVTGKVEFVNYKKVKGEGMSLWKKVKLKFLKK